MWTPDGAYPDKSRRIRDAVSLRVFELRCEGDARDSQRTVGSSERPAREMSRTGEAMTDDTVCPECGRTFVDTGGCDGMTTYIHSIDDSGQLASVDDYCFSDEPAGDS